MEELIIENFEKAAEYLKEKLKVLWPSAKNTPPTESNIVTACVQAFNPQDYYVFTEVPYNRGRIDFLAYHKKRRFLVVGEMKSDKKTYMEEMERDYERLKDFNLNKLPTKEFLKIAPLNTFAFQAYWTERSDKIKDIRNYIENKNREINIDMHPIISNYQTTKQYSLVEKESGVLELFFFLNQIM